MTRGVTAERLESLESMKFTPDKSTSTGHSDTALSLTKSQRDRVRYRDQGRRQCERPHGDRLLRSSIGPTAVTPRNRLLVETKQGSADPADLGEADKSRSLRLDGAQEGRP